MAKFTPSLLSEIQGAINKYKGQFGVYCFRDNVSADKVYFSTDYAEGMFLPTDDGQGIVVSVEPDQMDDEFKGPLVGEVKFADKSVDEIVQHTFAIAAGFTAVVEGLLELNI